MKIAYLITIYNNSNHLNRLIKALNSESSSFYIHIDKKSSVSFNIPNLKNIHVLKNNIPVYWGSFTFIKAVLLLIEESFKYDKYDYFFLLSGSDYPVRDNKYIQTFIEKNRENQFINISKMPNNDKPFNRVEYYYISTYDYSISIANYIKRAINLIIRKLKIKRYFSKEYKSLVLYGGSTWWGLSGECVEYIYKFIMSNPKLVKFYNNTLIPEEMFFHTIIGNSKFKKYVKNSFTYADWPREKLAHPIEITKKHIEILKNKKIMTQYGFADILFARKFSDNSKEVIKYIDSELRNSKIS